MIAIQQAAKLITVIYKLIYILIPSAYFKDKFSFNDYPDSLIIGEATPFSEKSY